ncbi:flagellar biosynthesis protein FlhB [Marinitoga sp. 1135]|uniref:Flagellar biosynthetic protein FlhB n=1 Tax=Marinitoga piezophila (strain DSM 14283 / JCM 11233 / KA3) TaxID=443254 RepID=H2J6H1_MARPK|nr:MULTISPECIES: flagellar biosynthesis protein FlhB [Marinitoga]AEX85156.1 flagellar biosynthetic protein FlhB [Marinitoga piezophila KA3]APT75655.1 flagellar biosynthesis protein FlhB [Marinitoga sp. 1137]NUU95395.1 flagellar biosynthesis protein FlhB [Marinitoga sp. 1135]NUU97323.1 flagellar biosynthesis protein FlhB [Marinitoga sp. 1138]
MDKLLNEYDFEINLQLFADPSKTEEPTPRRLQEARKEGNVPVSRELLTAFSFLAVASVFFVMSKSLYIGLKAAFQRYLTLDTSFLDENALLTLILQQKDLFFKVSTFLFSAALTSLILGMLQTKFLIAPGALKFDINKLNPISGFKRIFSMKTLFELLKSIVKISLVAYVSYSIIKSKWNVLIGLPFSDTTTALNTLVSIILEVFFKLGFLMLILGGFDYWYQKRDYIKNLRMTKQEVKEEMKDVEGDPLIKGQRMRMLRQIINENMMKEVPKATVVVTNPTHYAVALKYDEETHSAPVVVAKGVDEIAFRIKDIAIKSKVPIIRNPPVARQLYATVEIGDEIPEEMYAIVAKILTAVLKNV